MSLHDAFTYSIDRMPAGKEIQICLSGAGILRGVVSRWDVASGVAEKFGFYADVYQIVCEAQIGAHTPPVKMTFVFSTDALQWFSPGVTEEPRSRIVGAFDS